MPAPAAGHARRADVQGNNRQWSSSNRNSQPQSIPPRAGWIHAVGNDGYFCAFDLLHLNGKDLRDQPLLGRRAKLQVLIPNTHPFLFSEEFTGDAAAFFRRMSKITISRVVLSIDLSICTKSTGGPEGPVRLSTVSPSSRSDRGLVWRGGIGA
jgi:hypothetical protein